MIRDLTVDRAGYEMANAATWVKHDMEGRKTPAKPPRDVAANALATPNPPLPRLDRIATVPFFSAEGELVSQAGYHIKTRTLCEFSRDIELIPVPDEPEAHEMRMARNVIEKHLLVDFPFVGPADLAHAIAAFLLPFCRGLISGPIPLHVFEKPEPGTGASLLVQCIGDVIGHGVVTLTEARGEEEWARKIFSALRSAPTAIVFENVNRPLDSAALAAAITSPYFGDRITGTSEIGSVSVRCLWIATGNNPSMSVELLRRSIRVRLDAKRERPELRTGFPHPDLPTWVKEHRNPLIWAGLTLVQAWIKAGQPDGKKILGGFEAWSRVIGGILDVVGVPGLLENLEDHRRTADSDAPFVAFVAAWWERYESRPVATGGELIELAEDLDLEANSNEYRATRLGKLLQKNRDRRFGDWRIEAVGHCRGVRRWRLARVEDQ